MTRNRNKKIDFGGDQEHDADPGIFKRDFCHCSLGVIVRILCQTP